MVQQMPNLSLIEHARYTGQTLQSECKSIYMHVYRAHCINFVVTSFELELEHELYFHQLSTYLQCILINGYKIYIPDAIQHIWKFSN